MITVKVNPQAHSEIVLCKGQNIKLRITVHYLVVSKLAYTRYDPQ